MEAIATRCRRRPHTVALRGAVLLAVAFAVLVIDGADGIAFLLVVVGLAPATYLLLARRTPNRAQIALWWIGAIALIFFSIRMTRSAVAERRLMAQQDSCVLRPLDFDNDGVATLKVEWWPPRVQCRYGYSYQQFEDVVWEARWWIYWPFGLVPLSSVVVAGAARQSWRRRANGRIAPRLACACVGTDDRAICPDDRQDRQLVEG